MRAVVGLRRWRHNPLRRATDLAEAWVALVALLLMCVAAPATGLVVGTLTHGSLQQSARLQQEQRHPVTARVLHHDDTRAGARDAGAADAGAPGGHRLRRPVQAQWEGPDGVRRTGSLTTARHDIVPGDTFRIWTDDRGRPVAPPMTERNAHDHAVLAGIGTAILAAGLVEGARRIVVRRMVRRRYAELDRAWARAGQDWGRAGAGS
ncbi:Rv1733c family protein [Streptomyces lavendofoliae]|uniref:Rv1733c family protein n=1 Tax=Streptomyces lavendofoliae TaxID=67314 RepID=UPI003D8F6A3A